MSIRDNIITVLNYNEFTVTMPTLSKTYVLEPSEDNVPTLVQMPFSEVEYINSVSNAFRTGLLFFKDNQEDTYKELRILDWENIITNEEIENILINPTVVGLRRILEITDDTTFNRVRCIFTRLKNSDRYDLSIRVIKMIEMRYNELKNRKLKSEIVIQERDGISGDISKENENLKAQNEILMKQFEEMKQQMAKLMESNNTSDKIELAEVDVSIKKSTGRPKK